MSTEQETLSMGKMTGHFFYEQILGKLPYPTKKFTGQTVIVTGSNVGMGLEAARHFVRLEAEKVILAVRTVSKGEEAKMSIIDSEKCSESTVEVWELDLVSYDSTKKFADRAKELKRLDVVVENAGVYLFDFKMAEQDEMTITVNNVSTFLLGILLLPKLRETSVSYNKETVLTFTGSFVHYLTKFPEQDAEDIFKGLADEKTARMDDRYNVSKTIELYIVRELASQMNTSKNKGNVVTSILNPGFVDTSILRHNSSFAMRMLLPTWKKVAARTAEEGGRTLVWAAYGGPETHGKYLDDCKVGKIAPYIVSEKGAKTQKKLWEELTDKLKQIEPGIMAMI